MRLTLDLYVDLKRKDPNLFEILRVLKTHWICGLITASSFNYILQIVSVRYSRSGQQRQRSSVSGLWFSVIIFKFCIMKDLLDFLSAQSGMRLLWFGFCWLSSLSISVKVLIYVFDSIFRRKKLKNEAEKSRSEAEG